jgi:DNA repair ATPase RecN
MTDEKKEISEYGWLNRRVFPSLYYDATDTVYINLVMKLEYEKLTKTEFFRSLVDGFINDNKHIAAFIEEYKEAKQRDHKRSRRMIKKEREKAAEVDRKFSLSPEDIENIFDLIDGGDADV